MGWSTFNGHQIWMFLSLPKFCLGLEAITSSARRKRKWSTDYSKPPESRPSTLLNSSPFTSAGCLFRQASLTQNSKSWKQKQTRVCESRKQWVTEGSHSPFIFTFIFISMWSIEPPIRLIDLDLSILYIVDYEDLVFKQNRLILLCFLEWFCLI